MMSEYQYPDEPTTVRAYEDRVGATYAKAGRLFPDPNDRDQFRWFTRYGYSCRTMPEPQAANKHIAELEKELGIAQPDPGLLPPLAGEITLIDGGRGGIQDANGRRLSVNIHAGDFLARAINDPNGQSYIAAQLDYLKSVGAHALRIWFFLPSAWWGTPPRPGNANPNDSRWEPAVRWLLQALKDRGLYLQYDGGDVLQFDQTGRVHWSERAGQLIRESGVGLFSASVANEGWQNGESYDADPASVQRMVDVLHAFERGYGKRVGLSTLTSVRDEGRLNDYVRGTDAPTVISYHNDRGPTAPRHSTERAWTAAYAQSANETEPVMRAYKLDDEPAGVNSQDGPVGSGPGTHVSATNPSDMRVWRNLEAFGIYMAAHYAGRQCPTVLASCGVVSDEPFSTYPHFAHAAKIAKLIGGEAQGWKQFHGGEGRDFSPLRIVGVDAENKVRCDHALNEQTGEVRVCIYAVAPGTYRLPVISGFDGQIVTPDASLEKHPLTLTAGTSLDVSMDYGRILIGHRK